MRYSIIHFGSLGFCGEVQAESKAEAYREVARLHGLTVQQARERYLLQKES